MKYLSIIIFILSLALSSCGIFKNKKDDNLVTKDSTTAVVKPKIIPDKDLVQFIDSLEANYLDYKSLTASFSGNYETPEKSTPLRGILRMKKDSFIWISIRPGLGIELARAVFTPDSVKLLNRMKSEYFIGTYKFADSLFGISADYKMLQALISNEFFVYDANENLNPPFADFKLKRKGKNTLISRSDSLPDVDFAQNVYVNEDLEISKLKAIQAKGNRSVSVKYEDFIKLKKRKVPQVITTLITNGTKQSTINLEFKSYRLDKDMKALFKVPSSYKKMNFNKKKE